MTAKDLVQAVEASDTAKIISLKEVIKDSSDPWGIHLALYPLVARVLNPPFINPHLPKMYHVCRDFLPHLSREGLSSLVYLELLEYARRTKLDQMPAPAPTRSKVTFEDIEHAIADKDRSSAALLLAAFLEQEGWNRLCRRLLLLGSGYLSHSLGHSVSCTVFILLELLERSDAGAWPVLFLLADYFCKGGFQTTPPLRKRPDKPLKESLSRAVTGTGFVDLHHTITLYAIESASSFFAPEEHGHLVATWAAFLDDKEIEPLSFASPGSIDDYAEFHLVFAQRDVDLVLERIGGMLDSREGRSRLCAFLVTGVCDLYQGEYDPHYLTGLAALFWVVNTFYDDSALVRNALYQYLGFLFRNLSVQA
jgi:hypothetical protein